MRKIPRIIFASALTASPFMIGSIYLYINKESILENDINDSGSFMGFIVLTIILNIGAAYMIVIPTLTSYLLEKLKCYDLYNFAIMCPIISIPFYLIIFALWGVIDSKQSEMGWVDFLATATLSTALGSTFFLTPFTILWHYIAKHTKSTVH